MTHSKGFTLVELVIGIMVFAIALVAFTSLIVPQAIKSVDPIFQVRAAELGQSFINEIAGKSFDENSDRVGGTSRCNDPDEVACTTSGNLGDDSESRDSFDDVDDYDGLIVITNSLANSIEINGQDIYSGFSVAVTVVYDDNMDGVDDALVTDSDNVGNTKLITVTVTTPNGEDIAFSTYRSNY